MPPTDQLCRDLHSFLARKLLPRWLVQHGWFDFLNLDHPDTTDPVEFSCSAFLYLSSNDDDNWNECLDVLTAVVAYLKQATDINPSAAQLRLLKGLVQKRPLDEEGVQAWFTGVYA